MELETVEENVVTNVSFIWRMPSVSRGIYKCIVKSIAVPPKSILKWNRDSNLDPCLWNTKLKYFQFRFFTSYFRHKQITFSYEAIKGLIIFAPFVNSMRKH